jgi:FixJ family two-component response regulator
MIAQSHCLESVGGDGFVAELIPSRTAFSADSAELYDEVVAQPPTVFVVDPDPVTGTMVKDLLQGHELTVEAYASGREFFAAYAANRRGCLVLEQRIFDMSGLQVQRRLAEQNQRLPMVYVSSGLDVSTAVVLMRGGAINVLEKPLRSIELHDAIVEAVTADQNQRRKEAAKRRVKESIARLTRKERQLVSLIASAKSTKTIAAELRICSRAVELRRRGVMDKLGMTSSLELLRFAILAWQEYSHYLDSADGPVGADY